MSKITEIQHYHVNSELIAFYRDGIQRSFMNPTRASGVRLGRIARALSRQRGWEFYPFGSCAGWGLRSPELEEQIDQRWLDERMYTDAADLEPELTYLVNEAGNLADYEHFLIETIKARKRNLERLPEFVRYLEVQAEQRKVGLELADILEHHDQLSEAHKLLAGQQPAEVEA